MAPKSPAERAAEAATTTPAELTQQLAALTAAVQSFVNASAARAAPAEEAKQGSSDSGALAAKPAADPTVQVLNALTNKLTEAKTEHNGQMVHDFDFIYTEPSKYTFHSVPATS